MQALCPAELLFIALDPLKQRASYHGRNRAAIIGGSASSTAPVVQQAARYEKHELHAPKLTECSCKPAQAEPSATRCALPCPSCPALSQNVTQLLAQLAPTID